ncbi:MAG TPA: PP2C family protein-serine/threonine phosphatase [Thermomicrobiales bacterium]|jgi:serine phosphatase RsbU (regulator of sigma subunit)
MALAIDVAIAKTNKYASRDSGDTAEVVERPGGGLSVVVVDGQGSGAAAKTLSMMLTSKAVSLLKEGVRDGAVARAVHDSLFAFRHGKVSASFDIVSVDLRTKTLIATRNAQTPVIVLRRGGVEAIPTTSGPIGLYHFTRPSVDQLPAEAGLGLVLYTDGVATAGDRTSGTPFDVAAYLAATSSTDLGAEELADRILFEAIRRDANRPADDLTIVAVVLRQHAEELLVRRQSVRMPLP